MQVRKPARIRPQRYPAQEKQGRESLALALAEHRLKTVDPTFSHEPTNHDAIVRMLQRRRIAIPALIRLLDSPDPIIRLLAVKRLGEVKPAVLAKFSSPGELEKLLSHPDLTISYYAAHDLISLYSKQGFSGIPKLEGLLSHSDYIVRSPVTRGLISLYVNQGSSGISKLESLLSHSDYIVRSSAAQGLVSLYVNQGSSGISKLESLLSHPSSDVRSSAAGGLVSFYVKQGFSGIPKLEGLLSHPSSDVRFSAAQVLISFYVKQGSSGISKLESLLSHSDYIVRSSAAQGLVSFYIKQGSSGISKLEDLLSHPSSFIRSSAAGGLVSFYVKQGPSGIPKLEDLLSHSDYIVRSPVTRGLISLYVKQGPSGISKLESLLSHPSSDVRSSAAQVLISLYVKQGPSGIPKLEDLLHRTNNDNLKSLISTEIAKLKSRPLLLGNKYPFRATPYLQEVIRRISDLHSVSEQLTKEFKDQFVGIVVFGSISKGYATPDSDVDYAIIGKDPKVSKRFRYLAEEKKLPLCYEHYVHDKETSISLLSSLYYGLFIGDRKKLQQMQKKVFSKLNKEQWDEIRMKIYHEESELSKAFNRVKLGFREKQRILAATALRVPPEYEEMKKMYGLN